MPTTNRELAEIATVTPLHSAPLDDGSANAAAARRIRSLLGEYRLSASSVARAIGMKQATISRRTLGVTEWTLNEIRAVCQATGFCFVYITTGYHAAGDVCHTDGSTEHGPGTGVVRHQGLEPRTRWLSDKSERESTTDSPPPDTDGNRPPTDLRERRRRLSSAPHAAARPVLALVR